MLRCYLPFSQLLFVNDYMKGLGWKTADTMAAGTTRDKRPLLLQNVLDEAAKSFYLKHVWILSIFYDEFHSLHGVFLLWTDLEKHVCGRGCASRSSCCTCVRAGLCQLLCPLHVCVCGRGCWPLCPLHVCAGGAAPAALPAACVCGQGCWPLCPLHACAGGAAPAALCI